MYLRCFQNAVSENTFSYMKHFLDLLIGNRAYLSPSSDTGSRLVIKRSNTAIAGKFSPVIKSFKVVSIYDQVRCNNKPNVFNSCDKLKRRPQLWIILNYRFNCLFWFLYFLLQSNYLRLLGLKQFGKVFHTYGSQSFIHR